MKYFRLLDPQHKNIIVRAKGRSQQQFFENSGWVESGIMIKYFSDESDFYGMYEEITESEAHKYIGVSV